MSEDYINWENRIVDFGEAPANTFLAHELNARRHPGKQRDALRGSLNTVGWIAPVIVSKNSGKVLDGHARIEEALTKNEHALVPYVTVDVSAHEEAVILATLDPITDLAVYDKEALDMLLHDIQVGDPALQQMLSELAQKHGVTPPEVEFKEFDESIEKDVQYNECPECHHKWPK